MRENYLFYTKGDLRNYLESRKLEIKEEINRFDEDYILKVSEEDLVKTLVQKYILYPPILILDKKYQLEPKEVDVDVSQDRNRIIIDISKPFYIKGTLITVVIPFEGDEELFYYRPSTFSLVIPQGRIEDNELFLEYTVTHYDSDSLKNEIQKDIQQIESHLNWAKNDIDNFNNSLDDYIRNLIKTRKNKLLKDRNLVSSLDIPIKRRQDAPWTYSIPVKRKKIEINLPTVKSGKFEPEPALSMGIYEDILNLIWNMALVIERNPKAFSRMSEETLRDHFLVQLNGQYEGKAMGEVFNNQGKTDILIRYENKNVFIAECKFWKGEKKLLETIDQLLRYVTWRDTKTAILLFNKNKNFSEVLNKIPEIVQEYSFYKRAENIGKEGQFRYILHLPNDPNREVILTILVFDIPKL